MWGRRVSFWRAQHVIPSSSSLRRVHFFPPQSTWVTTAAHRLSDLERWIYKATFKSRFRFCARSRLSLSATALPRPTNLSHLLHSIAFFFFTSRPGARFYESYRQNKHIHDQRHSSHCIQDCQRNHFYLWKNPSTHALRLEVVYSREVSLKTCSQRQWQRHSGLLLSAHGERNRARCSAIVLCVVCAALCHL